MAKKPTFKSKNSIGSSGNMVGGPAKKGQTPMKTPVNLDRMLAESMPGIGMPKKATKKGSKKC